MLHLTPNAAQGKIKIHRRGHAGIFYVEMIGLALNEIL